MLGGIRVRDRQGATTRSPTSKSPGIVRGIERGTIPKKDGEWKTCGITLRAVPFALTTVLMPHPQLTPASSKAQQAKPMLRVPFCPTLLRFYRYLVLG